MAAPPRCQAELTLAHQDQHRRGEPKSRRRRAQTTATTCRSGAAATTSVPSFGSAGINRHRERNERVRHRRSSAPRWPWAMRWRPRGRWRSVGQGYVQAGLLSREISVSGCRRCPNERKATSPTAFYARAVGGPRAVREPLHAGSLDAREPGDPTLAQPADRGWAAQGRPWPYAWDVRAWEVGSPRSTDEAAEQGHGRGGGGGKGARRGEPGRHDTPRTQSRVWRATRAGSGAPYGCRGSGR